MRIFWPALAITSQKYMNYFGYLLFESLPKLPVENCKNHGSVVLAFTSGISTNAAVYFRVSSPDD